MWEDFDLASLLGMQDGYVQPEYSDYYSGELDQNTLISALSGDSSLYDYLPTYETPNVDMSGFYTDPWAPQYENPWEAAGLSDNTDYGYSGLENMLDYGGYVPADYQTPDSFQYDPYGSTSDYSTNPERSWADAIGDTTGGLGSTIAKVLGINTPQQQAQRAAQQQGQVGATGAQQPSVQQQLLKALTGQLAPQQQASSGQGARNALMGALAMAAALKPQKQLKIDPRGQVAQRGWNTTNQIRRGYAEGGEIKGNGGLGEILVQLVKAAAEKGLIPGEDGGQDDVVDIKAAPGEYIIDAEIVAALGDGNTNSGAKKLDKMRNNIREHKRTGGLTSIPPKAKQLEEYLGA